MLFKIPLKKTSRLFFFKTGVAIRHTLFAMPVAGYRIAATAMLRLPIIKQRTNWFAIIAVLIIR